MDFQVVIYLFIWVYHNYEFPGQLHVTHAYPPLG